MSETSQLSEEAQLVIAKLEELQRNLSYRVCTHHKGGEEVTKVTYLTYEMSSWLSGQTATPVAQGILKTSSNALSASIQACLSLLNAGVDIPVALSYLPNSLSKILEVDLLSPPAFTPEADEFTTADYNSGC